MTPSRIPRPTRPTTRSPAPQRQLSMAFESPLLQGMTAAERVNALSLLANLLMQAAGVHVEGGDDEHH